MITELLKTWVPTKHLPWILLLLIVGWVGWKTNDVAALIQNHYTETNRIVKISTQICKAVSKIANMSADACKEE